MSFRYNSEWDTKIATQPDNPMLSLCQNFFPFHLENNAYHLPLSAEDQRLFTAYPKVISTNICKTLGELCTRAGANQAKFLTVLSAWRRRVRHRRR